MGVHYRTIGRHCDTHQCQEYGNHPPPATTAWLPEASAASQFSNRHGISRMGVLLYHTKVTAAIRRDTAACPPTDMPEPSYSPPYYHHHHYYHPLTRELNLTWSTDPMVIRHSSPPYNPPITVRSQISLCYCVDGGIGAWC